jgi:hypothetical protein
MSDEMEKYSLLLRQLVDDYYRQQLPLDVYHEQRRLIFDQIEMEFSRNGTTKDAQLLESFGE